MPYIEHTMSLEAVSVTRMQIVDDHAQMTLRPVCRMSAATVQAIGMGEGEQALNRMACTGRIAQQAHKEADSCAQDGLDHRR